MTVYRSTGCITYRYDFWFRNQRLCGSTHQTTIEDARAVEGNLKAKLRRQAGGVHRPQDTPRFAQWAGVYYAHVETQLKAPQHVDDTLRVVLRFWGARPAPNSPLKIDPEAPYHDLRLADPIVDPDWIERFEQWVTARGVSAQTRNHYFSILSRMYRVALLPKFRKHAGVERNPFIGIPKHKTRSRQITLTVDQIRSWLAAAGYHIRLAAAIGALAPKLRLANILALQWGVHVDDALTYLTVHDHKTDRSGRPLVAPISAQLRAILKDARKRRPPKSTHIVTYQGRPVKSIREGVKLALERAHIPYGRDTADGATFHTLRHSMSTLLAEMGETEAVRQALMAHEDPATTKKYTHLRPSHERPAAERLSRALPIRDLVMAKHVRGRAPIGKTMGKRQGGIERRPTERRRWL